MQAKQEGGSTIPRLDPLASQQNDVVVFSQTHVSKYKIIRKKQLSKLGIVFEEVLKLVVQNKITQLFV